MHRFNTTRVAAAIVGLALVIPAVASAQDSKVYAPTECLSNSDDTFRIRNGRLEHRRTGNYSWLNCPITLDQPGSRPESVSIRVYHNSADDILCRVIWTNTNKSVARTTNYMARTSQGFGMLDLPIPSDPGGTGAMSIQCRMPRRTKSEGDSIRQYYVFE
jgi:hypothetical protein